ncbi:hypothetical protein ACLB2K_037632 [Fragaria x ananassa]
MAPSIRGRNAAAMHSYPLLSGAGNQRTAAHYTGFAVDVETAGVETQTGVTCRAARRLGFTDCQMPEFGKRKGTVRSEKKEKSLKVALRSTFSRLAATKIAPSIRGRNAAAMHSYPLLSGAGNQRTAAHYAGFAVDVETAGVETQTGVTCRAARRLGFTDC